MSDDWRSDRQGKNGRSPASGTNLNERRRGRSHTLLARAFDLSKHGDPRKIGAAAVVLLLIVGALVIIGNLGGASDKSAPRQTASQAQTPAKAYIPKPPAGHPAVEPQALPYRAQPVPGTPQSATPAPEATAQSQSEPEPASPSMSAGSYRFAATHKEFGGGCEGELLLSNAGLHFTCPGQPDINAPLAQIDRLDNDGVRLVSGKKYHFKISDDGKAKVESIFANWLDKARQNRAASGYTRSDTPSN